MITQKDKIENFNKPGKSSFWRSLRTYFFAGIATIFPLFVTIYLIFVILKFGDNIVGKYLNPILIKNYGFTIPGLGFVTMLLVIIGIGLFSTHFIGRKILPFLERLFLKIPLVANIYPSAKQLSDFLFVMKKEDLGKVVLVEYPYPGASSIGFVTNENLSFLGQEAEGKIISVFIPIAPSPFSGFLVLLPQEKVRKLDISVEQAIKFIVSGGVISP